MTGTATTFWQKLLPLTRVEWLVVVVVLIILAALLLEPVQWVSDGDITLPVRVQVFDPITGKPIPHAQVGIFKYRTILRLQDVEPLDVNLGDIPRTPTDAEGSVVLNQKFYTGASHRRPVKHAHLIGVWIIVEANGYSRVLVPCRYEEQPTGELRKRGELLVPVGLLATPAKK